MSGHIDGTGVIRSMIQEENAVWVSIKTSQRILDLIVEKGSVCIDGISLTVAKVDGVSHSTYRGRDDTSEKSIRRSCESGK